MLKKTSRKKLWHFRWQNKATGAIEGYNTAWGNTRREAIADINKRFANLMSITPAWETLKVDEGETAQFDKAYAGMFD